MNTVGNILKAKGNTVWTVSKDACVFDALKIFSEKRISSVVVVEGEKILGIFTERDFANKVGLTGKNAESVKIDEVMTSDLITVNPNQSVKVCMSLMTDKRIRHLPVIEDGKLVGIVSIGDVVKDLIEELHFLLEQMENYIKGLR